MADNNEKLVSAIGDFTNILQDLVNALNNNNVDDVSSKMNNAIDIMEEQLLIAKDIVAGITAIRKDNQNIKSKNDEILAIVQGIRDEKESGMFGRIASPDNKRDILTGSKSIILIAGAIFAIGKAFDVIDDVDFESVAALTLSLPILISVFSKLSNEKITPIEALKASFVMVTIAASIAISGAIIAEMPIISIAKGISALFVAGAMGGTMFLLAKAMENVRGDERTIVKVLSMSAIMPLMAAGILASAYVLNEMPEVSFKQAGSALMTGAVMGSSFLLLGLATKFINYGKVKELMLMPLLMPLIAGGLYSSALILNEMPVYDNATGILSTSITTATVILAAGAVIKGIQMLGVSPGDAVKGGLTMVAIGGAIALTSHVLRLGNYDGGPTVEWAKAMGLSMLAAVPTILILGAIASSGVGALVIGAGALALLGVAGAIVAVSHILDKGKYGKGPTPEWAEGTGKSILYFTEAMADASPGVMDFLTGTTLTDKINGMRMVTNAMIEVATVLNNHSGVFKAGPSAAWAEGTGKAIVYFTEAMNEVGEGAFDKFMQLFGAETRDEKLKALKNVINTMIDVGSQINKAGNVFSNYPSKDWAQGLGWSMDYIIQAMIKLEDEFSVGEAAKWFKEVRNMYSWIPWISNYVAKGNYTNFPKSDYFKSLNKLFDVYRDTEDITKYIAPGRKNLNEIAKDIPLLNKIMSTFTKSVTDNSISKASSDIFLLARSYDTLSNAMTAFSKSVQSLDIKKLPAANIIASNLIALSLIDNQRLGETLKVLENSASSVEKLYATITKGSQTESVSTNLFGIGNSFKGNNSQNVPNSTSNTEQSGPMLKPVYNNNTESKESQQMLYYLSQIAEGIDELIDLNNNRSPLNL